MGGGILGKVHTGPPPRPCLLCFLQAKPEQGTTEPMVVPLPSHLGILSLCVILITILLIGLSVCGCLRHFTVNDLSTHSPVAQALHSPPKYQDSWLPQDPTCGKVPVISKVIT